MRIPEVAELTRAIRGGIADLLIGFVCNTAAGADYDLVVRAPTTLELRRMKRLVAEGMEMGAVGLSTGLMYQPGLFSDRNEVIELTKVVQPYDGLYDSHTRDPVMRFVESYKEAIQIGRAARIRVKISHEKAVGLKNRGEIRAAIAMIEAERARALEVVTDQYPYD